MSRRCSYLAAFFLEKSRPSAHRADGRAPPVRKQMRGRLALGDDLHTLGTEVRPVTLSAEPVAQALHQRDTAGEDGAAVVVVRVRPCSPCQVLSCRGRHREPLSSPSAMAVFWSTASVHAGDSAMIFALLTVTTPLTSVVAALATVAVPMTAVAATCAATVMMRAGCCAFRVTYFVCVV